MKETNSRTRQKGTFAIEFSIVAVVLATLIVFSGDIVVKLSVKGKLDRLSYSLVNLVKEKTQLYADDEHDIDSSDAAQLYTIAKNSLSRTIGDFDSGKFGMIVEEQTYTGTELDALDDYRYGTASSTGIAVCQEGTSLAAIEADTNTRLSVWTTWNRMAAVYQVTLCYETDNMVADVLGSGFTTVTSSSAMLSR